MVKNENFIIFIKPSCIVTDILKISWLLSSGPKSSDTPRWLVIMSQFCVLFVQTWQPQTESTASNGLFVVIAVSLTFCQSICC